MESNMNVNNAANEYEKTEKEYVKGIESAHGRIKLIFETLLVSLDRLENKHPKTDFISFGKCQNALNLLSSSLDMEQGKDLAQNLYDLYAYCSEKLRQYLEDKNQQKIVEVKRIISGLSEAWKEIKD